MVTSDIERTNLEAHVELCSIRYSNLQDQLENLDKCIQKLDSQIQNMEKVLDELKTMLGTVNVSRQRQFINWGASIIGVLVSAIVYLLIDKLRHQ